MNIKITYNWLLEYLETDASPYELQKYLSLCGPSVERVHKAGDDYVLDIEITSNRIDMASVIGIAQEAQAILPMFGKKAKLKTNPLNDLKLSQIRPAHKFDLNIDIKNSDLVSRFTAIIFDGVIISESPDFIKKRLSAVDVKVINNVVDISNYLMITLGQPVHVFDYEKINQAKMIVRDSRKGEGIITLDGKELTLPGGDIVIEDGSGKLIDLCGIMGGNNSAISNTTNKVVLFVQTYNKEKVRKTVMTTNQRTLAATYFEKGLDEERVEPTTVLGSQLIEKYCQGKIASRIYDIYPHPYIPAKLKIEVEKFSKLIGINIDKKTIIKILSNLGFATTEKDQLITALIPPSRKLDISIAEDLIEEVARIYGYHNLPNHIPPVRLINQDENIEKLFKTQQKLKYFLKHLGLNEVINYSMVSKEQLIEFGLDPKKHLRLSNTLSKDIEYLRTCLTVSLFKNIKDNIGKKEVMRFFEIGKVYLKDSPYKDCPYKESPCQEVYRLCVAVNTDYFDLKGIIEAIYKELNIDVGNKNFCSVPDIIEKDNIFLAEIDFKKLVESYLPIPKYQSINPFAVIKLDKTFTLSPQTTYELLRIKAFQSKLLQKINVLTLYKNKLTLRFYYSSKKKNITEEEAKRELEKIKA